MHHNAEYCKWCKSALAEVQEQDNIKKLRQVFMKLFICPSFHTVMIASDCVSIVVVVILGGHE